MDSTFVTVIGRDAAMSTAMSSPEETGQRSGHRYSSHPSNYTISIDYRDRKSVNYLDHSHTATIKLDPMSAKNFRARGSAWFDKREFDEALADFTTAIQLDPKSQWGYSARVEAYKLKGEYDKEDRDYSDVIRIQPDNFEGHRNLSRLLATCIDPKVRDGKQALAAATRACELTHWNDSSCLDTLATAYAGTGDFPAAVKWQLQAIKIHPVGRVPALDYGDGFEGRLAGYRRGQPTRE